MIWTTPAAGAVNCHWLAKASGATVRIYDYLRTAQLTATRHRRLWIAPRLATIAADLGVCVRTVRRAIKWLQAQGLLAVQHRFARLKSGIVRQISNRIRVALTIEGALALKLATETVASRIIASAAALAINRTYSVDRNVSAGIEKKEFSAFKSSETYRQLMFDGIKRRR